MKKLFAISVLVLLTLLSMTLVVSCAAPTPQPIPTPAPAPAPPPSPPAPIPEPTIKTDELIYDDGEPGPTITCCWQSFGTTARKAVRFTPSSYSVSLDTARIYLSPNTPDSDHEQFAVEVYDDDGPSGAPSSLLGKVYTTATKWGWWDVDISRLGITITSGDFYIAYLQLTTAPDCEALGIDMDEPHYLRGWNKYEERAWTNNPVTSGRIV